ncbi:hypothetical protein [Planococcus lenghuensis]
MNPLSDVDLAERAKYDLSYKISWIWLQRKR